MDERSIGEKRTVADPGGSGGVSFPPGHMLGQYRLVRLLGRGGMGEVYEAEHTTLGLRYALKLLPPDFASRPGALDRFRREARVMAQLQHSHIVKVDDFGETGGRYWLRMELMSGVGEGVTSLADLAKRGGGKVEQKELLFILKQVVEGLGYAHSRGAIHRDLKPGNILLEQGARGELRAKVSDFGLVRLVGEEWVRSQAQVSVQRSLSLDEKVTEVDKEGTSTKALLGTYEYMSPEQKRGEEADERSDIYALGMIIYRLLTGQELGMTTPCQIDRSLAPGWDELARSALEQNRERRLADCRSLAGVLSKVEEEISQQEKEAEERRRREAEEAARREREERERREAESQREREAAKRRAAEARRAREEEARKREEAAARIKFQPPPPPAAPAVKPPRRLPWKIVGGVLTLCALAVVVWVWSVFRLGGEEKLEFVWSEFPRGRSGEEIVLDLGGGLKLEMVWIEPGEFTMGSPRGEDGRLDDEGPQHRVLISRGFWMGKYEVTQGQYQRIMRTNPSHFKGNSRLPVEMVSWNEAKAFCESLNRNRPSGTPERYTFRLPTEAEWEYACRAGTTTRFNTGNSDNDLVRAGWYSGNSGSRTHPVGDKAPNAWGLYDMHGNVWEWCEDDRRRYTLAAQTDPLGKGASRVLRGGSWGISYWGCRSSVRRKGDPGYASDLVGFRVVLAGR